MTKRFLAFDLGAESGRAMLGSWTVASSRPRDSPLSERAGPSQRRAPMGHPPSLARDAARARRATGRPRQRRRRHLGLSTTRCSASAATCSRTPITTATAHRRRDGRGVRARRPRARSTTITGIQFLPFNTLYQLYAACRATPGPRRRGRALVDDPGSAELLADRECCVRVHQRDHDAVHRRADPDVGDADAGRARAAGAAAAPIVEPGAVIGALSARASCRARAGTPVVAPACHDTASAVASVDGRRAPPRSSARGPGRCSAPSRARRSSPRAALRAQLHQRRRRLRHDAAAEEHRRAVAAAVLPAALGVATAGSTATRAAVAGAADERRAFRSLFDPDYPRFLHPTTCPRRSPSTAGQTGQPEPDEPAAFARAILESLAFKYRAVLESLEE